MTVAEVNVLVDAAVSAMDAGVWGTAESKLMQAQAGLAGMPDVKHGEGELRYDRGAIASLLEQVRVKVRSAARPAAGFSVAPIEFSGI